MGIDVYKRQERQREKIYVLDNGKSLMLALSQDLSQNRPAEAREHVRRFHELFFTLSPEKSAIEQNVKRALLLADKRSAREAKNLTQEELAALVNLSPTHVSVIERGLKAVSYTHLWSFHFATIFS